MVAYIHDKNQPAWNGYFYAVAMFLNALLHSLTYQQYFNHITVTGMRIRTGLIAAIYNKVCLESSSSLLYDVHLFIVPSFDKEVLPDQNNRRDG